MPDQPAVTTLPPVGAYARYLNGCLVHPSGEPASREATEVHAALRALLHDADFPCVGAKSIVNQDSYRFWLYPALAAEEPTANLAVDLYRFLEERPSIEGDFSSFIACFLGPKVRTSKEFEVLLWRQLKMLHAIDAPQHDWDSTVSSDTTDPQFSFSFGGKSFFIVGLAPANKRWARRFPWPTLVFNDHAQFERLREEQRFDRIKEVIRDRDERLHGSRNEMVDDFGKHSEARQYAGRHVGPNWRCPVRF